MSSLFGTISKLSLVVKIWRSEFANLFGSEHLVDVPDACHSSRIDLEVTCFISMCRGDEEISIMPMHASIGLLMDEIASFEFSYS